MNDSGIDLHRPIRAYHSVRGQQKVEILSPDATRDLQTISNEMPSLPFISTVKMMKKGVRVKGFNAASKAHWLHGKPDRGFIRIYDPNSSHISSIVVPLSLNTTGQQIAKHFGLSSNSLHVQFSGDLLRRLDAKCKPLEIQDNYLKAIGFSDLEKRQEIGDLVDLGFLLRFYAGRPFIDDGFGSSTLSTYCHVRKGRIFHHWNRRLCMLDGARLLIYPGLSKIDPPETVLLSRSKVEEAFARGKGRCVKITAVIPFRPLQIVYLAFDDISDFNAWISRCVKAAAKVPPISDLSNLQLESLPEQVFCIGSDRLLTSLNLKHNCLQSKPIWENVRVLGWLEDLTRLQSLRSLNLSDNELGNFPTTLVDLTCLTELNLSSNKLTEIPACIGQLTNLSSLSLQNNLLKSLPDQLAKCSSLVNVELSFNNFEQIPPVLSELKNLKQWLLAGNYIPITNAPNLISGHVTPNHVTQNHVNPDHVIPSHVIAHVHKLDLHLNSLALESSIFMPANLWHNLAHLDIRDNLDLESVDISSLASLQILECDRNRLSNLALNGASLLHLSSSQNQLPHVAMVSPPSRLRYVDLSRNQLSRLPPWITDTPNLEKFYAGHNAIQNIPPMFFDSCKNLKVLAMHHNGLQVLPDQTEKSSIECLDLHHNKLRYLPHGLLMSLHKLRYLNLAQNFLTNLPPLNVYQDLNKVQCLVLSANKLDENVFRILSGYRRLKVLDLAYNNIRTVEEDELAKLSSLEEICLSGNRLRVLPSILAKMEHLVSIKAHSNSITQIPDLRQCPHLRILDLANNRLSPDDTARLMAPDLKFLDLSCNSALSLSKSAFNKIEVERPVSMIHVRANAASLDACDDAVGVKLVAPTQTLRIKPAHSFPWQIGFCESSGNRNRLCISQIRRKPFLDCPASDTLIAMVDGGLNDEIPNALCTKLPESIAAEFLPDDNTGKYLQLGILKAHMALKSNGQRLGASLAVCHILSEPKSDDTQPATATLNIANLGHVQAVLCRGGEPRVLTEMHTLTRTSQKGVSEYDRVRKAGGVFTDDMELNGITPCTRLIGNSFLYPSVLPKAHVASVPVGPADEFLVMATKSLWDKIGYLEAVRRIRYIANPILAAKHLQDIAQSYGCAKNLSIIVVRFFFNPKLPEPPPSAPSGPTLSGSIRSKIYSAIHIAESDAESLSTVDEVQSEPQRIDEIKVRPNYYFEYKKQLREICASESTVYSSRLSSFSTITEGDFDGNNFGYEPHFDPRLREAFEMPQDYNADDPAFVNSTPTPNCYTEHLVRPSQAKLFDARICSFRKSGSSSSSGIGRSEDRRSEVNSNHNSRTQTQTGGLDSRTCSSPDMVTALCIFPYDDLPQSTHYSNGAVNRRNNSQQNMSDIERRTYSFGNLEQGIFTATKNDGMFVKDIVL